MRRYMALLLGAWFVVQFAGCATAPRTEAERQSLISEAQAAANAATSADSSLEHFLEKAHAYVVFPSVGKGGLIVGGAYGRGVVYRNGEVVGYADLTQANIGAQIGGQTFKEIVAFENEAAFDRFRTGKLSFAANASAVALKSGAAAAARYTDGVAIFVEPTGGLMVEASVGGQQLTFVPR